MKAHTDSFSIHTKGKGTYEVTEEVARIVRAERGDQRHGHGLHPAYERKPRHL